MLPQCDHDEHLRRQARENEYTTVYNLHPHDRSGSVRLAKFPSLKAHVQPRDGTVLFDPDERSIEYDFVYYTRYTQGIGTWIPLGFFVCRYCDEDISDGYWHFISWARYVRQGEEEKEGFVERD